MSNPGRALALAHHVGMAPRQARCHLSLGFLRHRAGPVIEARGELSTAVEMLGRMEMRYWLGPAQTLLAAASGVEGPSQTERRKIR